MIELPKTVIKAIAANEAIDRIAVDGTHNGKSVSVVIEPGEVPADVDTPEKMQAYLIQRLEEKATRGNN